ncbi:hypothetical protein HPB52_006538 [Rhipicephalus sanguineus]|uniref:Uncharacterized protein n=1 Tax=Rhipicephalus sanguineus TaxID=34632 RepID=A0A9D4SRT9_RHISA|nr:hypothetical protein HPB52_006538 [Rhipicephalus sanguineus]
MYTDFCANVASIYYSLHSSCVNVTINNILNISTCLGSNLNYCTGSTSCVLQGIYNYGSPQGVVNALGPLLSLIVSRLSLPSVNLPVLGNTSNVNFLTRNDTCQGPLTIQLPGLQNVSSCLLSQIPLDQFRQVIMGIGCQLITILSALARDASLGLTLQTALGSFSTALRLIVPTCSTTG